MCVCASLYAREEEELLLLMMNFISDTFVPVLVSMNHCKTIRRVAFLRYVLNDMSPIKEIATEYDNEANKQ